MKIYVKISLISIISLVLVFNHDFVIYSNVTMSQIQTQKLMTSQIRSHIAHSCAHFYAQNWWET